MKCFLRNILIVFLLLSVVPAISQTSKWQDVHKVKKHGTIYGIAHQYGITEEELMNVNPEMRLPDYKLKKGTYLSIPFPTETVSAKKQVTANADDMTKRAIRVGVLLPLHDENGDGKRMTEYYRGMLLACDSLKHEGISVDLYAWNVALGDDVRLTLLNKQLQNCDIIFGPLYTPQVAALSKFVKTYNIKLVIPFSITSSEVCTNRNIFQVYQTENDFDLSVVKAFKQRFGDYHPVFVDCNDTTNAKGAFTSVLRRQLESDNVEYSITNLKSSEAMFAKAFSRNKPNIVIINSGRLWALNVAIAKLQSLLINVPGVVISMFGYPEWQTYISSNLDNFFKFDVYYPSTFYRNPLSKDVSKFEKTYHYWFKREMMSTYPRYAMVGFDHAYYFIKGLSKYGKNFYGGHHSVSYKALQNPLWFEQISDMGGFQNRSFVIVHYNYNHNIEILNY